MWHRSRVLHNLWSTHSITVSIISNWNCRAHNYFTMHTLKGFNSVTVRNALNNLRRNCFLWEQDDGKAGSVPHYGHGFLHSSWTENHPGPALIRSAALDSVHRGQEEARKLLRRLSRQKLFIINFICLILWKSFSQWIGRINKYNNPSFATMSKPSSGVIVYRILNVSYR
jgi:hypothetical protein